MSIHLFGQGKVVNYEQLKVWAERGLICIEDARDNSFVQLSVKDALLRIRAINDTLQQAKKIGMKERTRDAQQKFVERMLPIIKQAQEQGMPTDASAVRDLNRRRKKQVVVPTNYVSLD